MVYLCVLISLSGVVSGGQYLGEKIIFIEIPHLGEDVKINQSPSQPFLLLFTLRIDTGGWAPFHNSAYISGTR